MTGDLGRCLGEQETDPLRGGTGAPGRGTRPRHESMTSNQSTHVEAIGELAQKLGAELAFAQAGMDTSLLPVNCFLMQIEETVSGAQVPPELARAARLARSWLDRVFETTTTFDEASIANLQEWHGWVIEACHDIRGGLPVPEWPAKWADTPGPAASGAPAAPAGAKRPVAAQAAAETELTMNVEADGELLREFVNESQEHLQNIELGVLKLEEDPRDAETLNSIFRAFHTFKGGSGLLNLIPVKNLAHELESLLDLARQHKLAIGSDVINVILAGGDILKQFVNEIAGQLSGERPRQPRIIPTAELIAVVRSIVSGEAPQAQAPGAPAPAAARQAPAEGAGGAAPKAAGSSSVKVDTTKLDGLVDLIGELVIAQSLVVQDGDVRSIQSQQLARNLAQLRRITNELQRTAMSLRMVPIRATFQKMVRLVRDLSAKEGKQVELKISGEETELDRTIVEQLNDPLVHMIRNAVDHGVERPDVRASRGKPGQGTIHLRAFHKGGNIVIQIEDDGNGLNKDRILSKAIEKGIVRPDEQLSEKEIFDLIFAAGFSTAEKITEVSGRGVGMDVVRRNIEQLRGKTEIHSVAGHGSTFTIYLPLTLAIIDGLIVGVGDQRYILPTLGVRESFRPDREMLSTVQQRGEVVNVRGGLSPLLRLYDHFGVTPRNTDPTKGVVVVVGNERENRCLLVDQLLGKQEVVIKGLGETFQGTRGLAGAAILGDGSVGLILDVDAFVRLKPGAQAKLKGEFGRS
jgi:two-component system chemotaxis sensor kinase CheA